MLNKYSANTLLAKSHAMYAGRLTESQYNDLLNCKSVGDVATYLKNKTVYADVLQDAATETMHRKQLETILHKRLFNQYAALCRYELSIGTELYRSFIIRSEVEEILTFMRFLCSKHPENYIFSLPTFLAEHTEVDLFALAEAKTFDDVLRVVSGTDFSQVLEPFAKRSKETGEIDYFDIEVAMKKYEFNKMRAVISDAFGGKYRQEVTQYMEREMDITNLIHIYRLKHMVNATREELEDLFVFGGSALSRQEMDALAGAASEEEFLARLKSTQIGRRLQEKSYDYLEEGLQKVRFDLEKRSFRFGANPYIVMFAYIFLAENEVQNITHIIEGIRYSIPPETIRSMLIGIDG